MGAVQLKEGTWWVGAIDFSSRSFHGFETPRGTTYNAYLIVDDTIALIDTVKAQFAEQMLARIGDVVDPADVGVIVTNHVEMDHSSGLAAALGAAPGARVLASQKGVDGLEKHYQRGWSMRAVRTGEELSLGKRTLRFVEAPMVHWPDSMFTYVVEDRVLFPNDAFGQHYASQERFDDEVIGDPELMFMARDYFANIVLPYSSQVRKVLGAVADMGIEPEIVAPSHGVVWRSHFADIRAAYERWTGGVSDERIIVVFDTMWGSTRRMAEAIAEGVAAAGMRVNVYDLQADPIARIMGEVMEAKGILVGGPTLNAGVYPSVAGFLAYVKGLRPRRKVWGAFGSYGWGPVGQKAMHGLIDELDGESLDELALKFVPTPEELDSCRAWGARAVERVREAAMEEPAMAPEPGPGTATP